MNQTPAMFLFNWLLTQRALVVNQAGSVMFESRCNHGMHHEVIQYEPYILNSATVFQL